MASIGHVAVGVSAARLYRAGQRPRTSLIAPMLELTRYFAPWTPIPVAPIGRRLFSERGLWLMASEAVMFLPLFAFALWPRAETPR